MKVILKRDEFNELNKEYEVHHIEQDKYGNKKIYLNKHRWVAPSLIEKYIEGENMKTIKIIDLLNKIANGEEPKIKYDNHILKYNKNEEKFIDKDGLNSLYEIDFSELNDEVEIIEEPKKIEKLDLEENAMTRNERYIRKEDNKFVNLSVADYELAKKINELIYEVNKLKEE